MDFLLEYAGFLARVVTVVLAIAVILVMLVAVRQRAKGAAHGQLQVTKLNDFYRDLQDSLDDELLTDEELKVLRKQQDKAQKLARKTPSERARVFVLDFDGDIKASAVESLRHEVTAILGLAKPADEVVVRLESGGGMVHSYGLASSQLARLREANVPLTICVDKVAASGGYMMACLGSQILSAPFAILGSIGVVAQVPNVHRLLKKHDVDVEVLTAGEYKRTLTMLGENTEKGREKFQQDLEITHQLFKDFVARHRPQLAIEQVATGEVWLGQAALEMQLVDGLKTSDQYLFERAREADLYELNYAQKKSLQERFGLAAGTAADRVLHKWWGRLSQPHQWH